MSSTIGKKKASLGKIPQNPATMKTRCTATLNLLLGKGVDELISTTNQLTEVKSVSLKKKAAKLILQKKTQDENIKDITKEKGDKRVFLTLIQGNTSTLKDVF